MTHEARIIRHAGLAYTRARQEAGLATVERALRGYYDWRAEAASRPRRRRPAGHRAGLGDGRTAVRQRREVG
ncbi:hypothetical protein ACFSTC_38765 [Nonomuraea ferruginea]